MNDHSLIEELIAVRALGGLETEDRPTLDRAMAEHGADCAECRRLGDESDEVAGRLAFALRGLPVRAGLEDEIVAVALGPAARPRPRRAASATWWRGVTAVAAAVVLFFGGFVVRGAIGSNGTAGFAAAARLVSFRGEAGHLEVAYRPGAKGLLVVGSGLGSLPSGRVYELWRFEGQTPVRTACFTPAAGGDVVSFVDAGLANADRMAVTVESSSCPSAPTTEPVLSAQVPPA